MRPDQTLNWMHHGTERLLVEVAGLPDEALGAPTALPGWTRAYLLSHIAANADALRNLVHWARTGEERRMYASTEAREADIAAGAELPPADLRAWVSSSAADLAADLDALDGAAWDAKIITAQGLTRSANEIPWMRAREIYIHSIDLAAGITFADLPPDFLAALLDDVTGRRSAVGGCGIGCGVGRWRWWPGGVRLPGAGVAVVGDGSGVGGFVAGVRGAAGGV